MRSLPLLVALLAGCGSSAPRSAPPASAGPAPAPAQPAAAETTDPPFSAAELRAAFVVGLTLRYRVLEHGMLRVEEWKVTAADADTCTLHVKVYNEAGTSLVEDSGAHTSKWTELESHGRFPAAFTTRTDSSVEVPAGRFDTWFYQVEPATSTAPTRRFHFARTLPGPPVWLEFKQGDMLVSRMELLSRTGP